MTQGVGVRLGLYSSSAEMLLFLVRVADRWNSCLENKILKSFKKNPDIKWVSEAIREYAIF